MKTNMMKALAMYNADIEDALEFVSQDKVYALRSGRHVEKHKRKGNAKNQFNAPFRSCNRTVARLGKDALKSGIQVPAYFRVKPKDNDYSRDTIRKAGIDEEAMNDEYEMYSYKAAGMC